MVVNTVLAIEDEDDFYEHSEMNVRATLRALLANVESGDVQQGGSTITQQLVKNALLTPEQDVERKVQEAVLALRLEDQMSAARFADGRPAAGKAGTTSDYSDAWFAGYVPQLATALAGEPVVVFPPPPRVGRVEFLRVPDEG